MSLKTTLLSLFKYEQDKDGASTFNIKQALNDNWDKIDAWAQKVKEALDGAVYNTRRINGKRLNKDVTLTASDVGAAASDHTHDTRYYTRDQMDTKMSGAVTTDNIMSKLDTVPISKGGTGVTSMVGTDYSTNRPRGIVLATEVPSSVPNGCVVLVASRVSS